MNRYTDELKQKLAWQVAYELRTCPPDEILLAHTADENLRKHLTICHLCRQRRELQTVELQAWETLKNRFADSTVQPATGTARQPGQVWTISSKAGGWDENGRYLQPPSVLLLIRKDSSTNWLVSQLYPDKRLMGQGDIELGETFGFAQGWNCYQVADNMLDKCIGCTTEEQIGKVIGLSVESSTGVLADDTILANFREMEREVALFVQSRLIDQQRKMAEPVTLANEEILEQLFGTVVSAYRKLVGYRLPEYADTMIDLLSGASDSNAATPVTASSNIQLQVNIVSKQLDGALTIKTVLAALTDSNWEDGDYYVAGKLCETQPENLFLVASLSHNGEIMSECQGHIEKDSPYFDIIFKGLKKAVCSTENIKLILVKL